MAAWIQGYKWECRSSVLTCDKYFFHNILTSINVYTRTYRPEESEEEDKVSLKTCLWQLEGAQETGRLKPNWWSFSHEIDVFWFASFGFAAVMYQLPEQLLQGMQVKRRKLADEEVKIQ